MSPDQRKQASRARLAAAQRRPDGDRDTGETRVDKLRHSLGIEREAPPPPKRDPSKPKVKPRAQVAAEPEAKSRSERAAERRAATNQPPLPLSLGAIMVMGFAATLVLSGLTNATLAPSLRAGFSLVGAGFIASAWFMYRRKGWAWGVCVCGAGIGTGFFVVYAIVSGAPQALLNAVFFVCPLLLLLLPGSRAALEWGGLGHGRDADVE